MTVQEVKEQIQEYDNVAGLMMNIPHDVCMAIIEALSEVEQYRALGTVEELKEAREKQVAKKVIKQKGDCYGITKDGKEYHEYLLLCPNCHRVIKRTEALDVRCKYCGQALKWSEEDD